MTSLPLSSSSSPLLSSSSSTLFLCHSPALSLSLSRWTQRTRFPTSQTFGCHRRCILPLTLLVFYSTETSRGGGKKERKVAATGRNETMTRSWLKLNGLANLFWALMRLESQRRHGSRRRGIFRWAPLGTFSFPPLIQTWKLRFSILKMPRMPGDNNRHLNARSPVSLLWRADS